MRLLRALPALALALAACTVESSRPPVTPGDGVLVDGSSQTVSIDATKVPIQDKPCEAGQVLRRASDGKAWECVTPAEVSPDHIPSVATCAAGQLVSRTEGGWACVDPLDPTKTPIVPTCPTGQFVQKTADGWRCNVAVDPDLTPVVADCPTGQVITRTAAGWACAPAIDAAKTPSVAACDPGQVVVRTATGWACQPAVDGDHTPVVAQCAAGQYVRRTLAGWECGDIPGVDPQKTPVVPTCAAGQYVRRTAAGWECTALVGDLTGNVVGNVTGNVVGNLSGNVTGDVVGNLTGDTRGTHTGAVFGNVTGNVTGDLTGNTAGTHTGPVVGNVTGNLTGTVKGNVSGNVTGDLTGNVTGNTNGIHTGAVIGNVTGNVTGNTNGTHTGAVVGDVTGNVSGTASNVSGVVAVGHGGTGASNFGTGSLVSMGASNMTGIAPGAPATVLASTGTSWAPASLADLGAAGRTLQPQNLFVRVDGSDANCNGSADVADSAGARPNCAVASPQAALDKLPDIVMHSVQINLGAGTFRVPAGGIGLDIAKVVRASVPLVIKGVTTAGGTVLSGATAAAPTTPVAVRGLSTSLPIQNLVVQNITFDRFTDAAVRIARSTANLENITASNSGAGIVCEQGSNCGSNTTITLTNNVGWGLLLSNQGRYSYSGTINTTSNVANSNGVLAEYGSILSAFQSGASGAPAPSLTINVPGVGLQETQSSSVSLIGTASVTSSAAHAIIVQERSSFSSNATLSATTSAAGTYALLTNLGSYTSIVGGSTALTCNGSQSVGFASYHQSVVLFFNQVATTVTGCGAGESTLFHSTFYDASTGTKTNGPGVGVQVELMAVYHHGGFPAVASGNCKTNSFCE